MTLNPASQWRLELAVKISQYLRRYAGIRAILVGGSVARGYADAYSDLEMPLIWETLPTDETRLAIAAGLGASFLYPYDGPAREDNLLVSGFQIDFWHNTVANDERVIERVLTEYSLDLGDSNFMDTLRFCIPLHGEQLIRSWQEKARQYPDELAARNIQQAMEAIQADHLLVQAERGNLTLLYGQISRVQRQIFRILLALNRAYFPTDKWIYPTLARLALKPPQVETRFRRAYSDPPAEAAADTARLWDETLALVVAQFPHLDTAAARRRMRLARQAHTGPIQLP